ncbi:hypothetical protein OAO03_01985 [Candidatus Pelagibacter ubique]|nr:hypothetical protein [Candidatus Pelagibacter ubique]
MGGPSGGSGGGDTGPANRYRTPKKQVVDFIKGGGVVGAVVRGISKGIKKSRAISKERKINDSYLGSPDYQGDVSAKRSYSVDPRTGRDNDNGNNQVTQKSIEQPKVKSQMNNTDVKSDMITAEAPAITEMSADEIALKNKRKGRKKTILTSVTGVDDYPTLSKKTLLG